MSGRAVFIYEPESEISKMGWLRLLLRRSLESHSKIILPQRYRERTVKRVKNSNFSCVVSNHSTKDSFDRMPLQSLRFTASTNKRDDT